MFNNWVKGKQDRGDLYCLNGKDTIESYLQSIFAAVDGEVDYSEFIKLNSFRDFYSNRKKNLKFRLYEIFQIPHES